MGQISWMFSLIPDSFFVWIYYIILTLGLGFYVLIKLVSGIPMITQYKLPAELVGVLLLVAGSFLYGGYGTEMIWRERVAEMEKKVKDAEERSQQVTIKIQEKIVYKTKIVKQQEVVYIDRIKEVAAKIDAECKVAPEALDILNNAADNPVKETAK